MMEILTNIGLMMFWFAVVLVAGTSYVCAIIFAIKKGLLGETSSKVVYFATFVILAAIVFKLPLL